MSVIKMSGNNTTTDQCLDALNETVSCVSETGSMFDDIEVILLSIAVLLGIAAWARNKYKTLNADGVITLDEMIDSVGEAKEKAAEAEEALKEIEDTLAKYDLMTVAELKAALKEKGLAVSGKKADLVARIKAHTGGV